MTGVRRLVGLGSVVMDLVLHVEHLPERGGDVLASASALRAGGGINVLTAAGAAGLPVAYAGAHGTGPFGDLVRGALAAIDAEVLLPATPGQDTGVCVVLVDETGERTFATTVGAEGRLTPARLRSVRPGAGDAVCISGYDLAYPHAATVTAWVSRLPDDVLVVFDPGPLVHDVDDALSGLVLDRCAWLSLNAREAAACTQGQDPVAAAATLLSRGRSLRGVVVRDGAAGAVLAVPGREPVRLHGVPVQPVVDTNGAGDVHVGTFVAALAPGLGPDDAVAAANRAAAAWVARPVDAR